MPMHFRKKTRQSTTLLTWLFLSWNPKECIPLMNSPRLYGSLRNASRYIEESNSKTKDFIFLMLKWLYLVIFKTAKTMASSQIQNSDDYRGSKFETSLILINKQYSSGVRVRVTFASEKDVYIRGRRVIEWKPCTAAAFIMDILKMSGSE